MDNQPVRRRSLLALIFLTPAEPRLRAGWRLALHFLLLGILIVLFGVLVGLLVPAFSQVGQAEFVLGQSVTLIAVTVSVYLARRLFDRRTFTSLGLKLDRHTLPDLLFGVAIAALMMGFIYLVEYSAGWLQFEGFSWQFEAPRQVWGGVGEMLIAFVAVAWQEELMSRGYWLQNFAAGLNLFWGVLISSAIFALAHLANPNVSWIAIAGLMLAGVFLAYGYLRTRRLWLPMGLHLGWNFFEGTVFGFPVSGLSAMPRLIRQSVAGPELWTGGEFGPEAGLVLLPALALGALLIYLLTRGRLGPGSQTDGTR